VTTSALAASYLKKALLRLEMLRFAYEREGFSDVVREAQELVELALKGMLRAVGVDPPKVHEVGATLLLERARFPSDLDVDMLARISRELRKDRELAFYGAEDLIPTEAYDRADAETAIRSAELVVEAARRVIGDHRSD
jgi:HEPN domain-containing protein